MQIAKYPNWANFFFIFFVKSSGMEDILVNGKILMNHRGESPSQIWDISKNQEYDMTAKLVQRNNFQSL